MGNSLTAAARPEPQVQSDSNTHSASGAPASRRGSGVIAAGKAGTPCTCSSDAETDAVPEVSSAHSLSPPSSGDEADGSFAARFASQSLSPVAVRAPASPLGTAGADSVAAEDVTARLATCKPDPWNEDEFEFIKTLQAAQANFGRVDLMRRGDLNSGTMVAVKRMPKSWVREGHAEFCRRRPSKEQPWLDICLVRHLHARGFQHVCEPLGVFADARQTYVVTTFANRGDLFGEISHFGALGLSREAKVRPLVRQVVNAVRELHDMGIVHGDLSPENFVLNAEADGTLQVKMIDFGMASFKRRSTGSRGKHAFEAPEMHRRGEYDAYLSDAFALGVVIYAMAAQDYPWSSTKPGACKIFSFVEEHGLRCFLKRRKAASDESRFLIEVLSAEVVDLVEGLTCLDAGHRLSLGEACWEQEAAAAGVPPRPSVLESAWLRAGGGRDAPGRN
eukprot:TRINITY_DN14804_c0_g1_i1.p1 TRINITY_DN14804_c0_g1~~TRINITY_DN14804_c0_g1_i1.p1  ORF type:complete len:448 (-),score=98.77 TRINITY_DN14804_c0_g1_i1:103-1446(-)